MSKKKVLGIIGYCIYISVGFLISTICSVLLMTSMANDALNYKILFGMAVMLQVSTSLFIAKGMLDKRVHIGIRIILVCIGLFLYLVNIIGNIGTIQNNANQTKNIELKQSAEYRQLESNQTRQNELYEMKKKEIESLSSYDQQIQEMKKVKDSYSNNYITKKENIQKEINSLAREKTEKLAKLNSELQNISTGISPINVSNLKFESEKGFISTFNFLSKTKIIRFIFKNISGEQLQNYFFMMVSIVFEFIQTISLYLLSVFLKPNVTTDESTETNNPTPDPSPKQKIPDPIAPDIAPKLNLVKSNRSLGVKASSNFHLKKTPKNISDSDIKKYLDYMYKTAENDISQGYIKISKNIELSQEKCRKIKGWLENEGIIKSEGGRTVIVKKEKVG